MAGYHVLLYNTYISDSSCNHGAAELFTDFSWKVWILKEPLWFTQTLKGYGFSPGIVYLVWISIVIAVYPQQMVRSL
jgi:hypothetical protein